MKITEQNGRYLAVRHADYDRCANLGWQWTSIVPWVLAGGEDAEEVAGLAEDRAPGETARIYDRLMRVQLCD